MTCMTTKQKFEVDDPEVVVLQNGRYAYRTKCPWDGKGGKELFAYKFCSAEAFRKFTEASESKHIEEVSEQPEQLEAPESPEHE